MKIINFIILSTTISIVLFSSVRAQEMLVNSGSNIETNIGSVSYTVGQVFTSAFSNENGTLTEGVQQPYEVFTVIGVKNESIKLEISVSPNPTLDKLTLNLKEVNPDIAYQLFDINGTLIESNIVLYNMTQIDFAHLKSSNYILRIIDFRTKAYLKTFKIIKK